MTYNSDDTIFVQIASYRDPELQHTLQDLFAKAKKPENIFVGICHQYDMKNGQDKHLFEIPFPRPNQLRIDEIDYRESQGCCFVRSRVQKLWRDEKWTLMIDSHMRFEKNWDEILITQLKNFEDNNIIISQMCGDCLQNQDYSSATYKPSFNNFYNQIIPFGFGCVMKNEKEISAMISARFLFGLSAKLLKINYDQNLYFFGEEVTMAVRLWTCGLNIFSLNKIIAHHKRIDEKSVNNLFKVKQIADSNILSNFHKHDHDVASVEARNNNSLSRVRHLLNTKKSKGAHLKDLHQYNLGNSRSLRDYERFSGLDFRKTKMRQHSKEGLFEKWNEVARKLLVKKIFNSDV